MMCFSAGAGLLPNYKFKIKGGLQYILCSTHNATTRVVINFNSALPDI